MTVQPTGPGLAERSVLAELTGLLAEVTGEDERWAAGVTPASRLEGDLRLESVELAALSDLLARTYGEQVDVAAFVAELDIDQIIGLTVGDLVRYVVARRPVTSQAEPGGRAETGATAGPDRTAGTGGTAGPGGSAGPGGTRVGADR